MTEMEESFNRTIEPLQEQLKETLQKEAELKKLINQICVFYKQPPLYPDGEMPVFEGAIVFRKDQFYGKPFATAVKELLKMRGRAISAQDILDGLTKGGYDFPEKWKENRLKNLAITLSKNSKDFVQIDTDGDSIYGLWEFYPQIQKKKDKKKNNNNNSELTENLEENLDENIDDGGTEVKENKND